MALETIRAAADNHGANVLPIIREIRGAGATNSGRLLTPSTSAGFKRRAVVRDDGQERSRADLALPG